jgi:hypothetical protein
MARLRILLIFVILFIVIEQVKSQADAFSSGSILAPWGGNLGGGSWGFSSGLPSASYRYNNGLGFL